MFLGPLQLNLQAGQLRQWLLSAKALFWGNSLVSRVYLGETYIGAAERTAWSPESLGPSLALWLDASDFESLNFSNIAALVPGTNVNAGSLPKAVVVSKDNKSVYVINENSSSISIFSRNLTTGELTSQGSISTETSPVGIDITSDGTSVYVVNSNTIGIYSRNTVSGALTSIGTISSATGLISVLVSPDGKSVYSGNSVTNAINLYSRNLISGALTFQKTTNSEGAGLKKIFISRDGLNVYAVNSDSNTINSFARNIENGVLSVQSINSTGAGLNGGAVSPDGAFVYTANHSDNTVGIYRRNSTNGALTFVGTNAVSAVSDLVISEDSSSVYAICTEDNLIAYRVRNKITGALTMPTTSSISTGAGTLPISGAVSADGISFYVVHSDENTSELALGVFERRGRISQWNDKSSRNFHLSQETENSRPGYSKAGLSGNPAIVTDGGDSLSRSNVSVLRNVSQASIVVVAEYPTTGTFLNQAAEVYISTGLNSGNARMFVAPNAPSVGPTPSLAQRQTVGGRRDDFDTYQSVNSSTLSADLRGTQFFKIAQLNFADGSANHWTNGNQDIVNAEFQLAGNTSNTDSILMSIFMGGSNNLPANVKISEIMVIEGPLSGSDRQTIEGYLAWKWSLVGNLPSGHPFKNVSPRATPDSMWDADALDYIRRVERADGETLELGVKLAINDFVVGCKLDGIWKSIKASCIMAGARTVAGALTPLVGESPTNFDFVSGDYDRKTGLTGNGTTKYLNSNRPSNSDLQDNHHLSCYVSTPITSGLQCYMGVGSQSSSGATQIGIDTTSTPVTFFMSRSSTQYTDSTASSAGFLGLSRAVAGSFNSRINSTTTSASILSNSPLAGDTYIFARNIDSTAEDLAAARLAFYSIGLSINLHLLDNRVTALINAYSAAIL